MLLAAESPGFLVQGDLQDLPGDAEGWPHVGWVPSRGGGRALVPSSRSWPAPLSSRFPSTRPRIPAHVLRSREL